MTSVTSADARTQPPVAGAQRSPVPPARSLDDPGRERVRPTRRPAGPPRSNPVPTTSTAGVRSRRRPAQPIVSQSPGPFRIANRQLPPTLAIASAPSERSALRRAIDRSRSQQPAARRVIPPVAVTSELPFLVIAAAVVVSAAGRRLRVRDAAADPANLRRPHHAGPTVAAASHRRHDDGHHRSDRGRRGEPQAHTDAAANAQRCAAPPRTAMDRPALLHPSSRQRPTLRQDGATRRRRRLDGVEPSRRPRPAVGESRRGCRRHSQVVDQLA